MKSLGLRASKFRSFSIPASHRLVSQSHSTHAPVLPSHSSIPRPHSIAEALSTHVSELLLPPTTDKMATGGGDAQLFEDNFTIYERDQSKYDRVARITASTEDSQTQLTLDVNIELFPIAIGERLTVVLATSLSLDGTRDSVSDGKGWRDVKGESSLADLYDYVCHGKIYKFEDGADGQTL